MKSSRRSFIKLIISVASLIYAYGLITIKKVFSANNKSTIFKVDDCEIHKGGNVHKGIDSLLSLLAYHGIKLYRTKLSNSWGDPFGIIAANDIVLIKINCQWKCRGTTNTDLLRGLIHRILQHPDGFSGEVVIIENGQGEGSFDGNPNSGGLYSSWPEIDNAILINAEEETVLTVDYLVNTVFQNEPVSSYLLDSIGFTFISNTDHITEGYRRISDVSYPCFTTAKGHRIELREGVWNGAEYDDNLKLINFPVLKTHGGTGITGALKHTYGILSMWDGVSYNVRHYDEAGTQCAKMFSLVRIPDLNILDCIWVNFQGFWNGYPPENTHRSNIILASYDPVALDYYASKYVMLPLGGSESDEHDPDTSFGLSTFLSDAMNYINSNGGIHKQPSCIGDDNIEMFSTIQGDYPSGLPGDDQGNGDGNGGGGVGGCFIATAVYGSPISDEVKVLKSFRDKYIVKYDFGNRIVNIYYKLSPKFVTSISKNIFLKTIIKTLLYPAIFCIKKTFIRSNY